MDAQPCVEWIPIQKIIIICMFQAYFESINISVMKQTSSMFSTYFWNAFVFLFWVDFQNWCIYFQTQKYTWSRLSKLTNLHSKLDSFWVTLKHGVPQWGTPRCTDWCTLILSYLDKFLKHFNVIFNLLGCEGHGARMKFRQETWQGQSLVFALLTLEVHPRTT